MTLLDLAFWTVVETVVVKECLHLSSWRLSALLASALISVAWVAAQVVVLLGALPSWQ